MYEYETFATVWVLPHWFKVLCIRQYQVIIGAVFVESEALFVVARRIYRMACSHEESRPDFTYRLLVAIESRVENRRSDGSLPVVS